METREETKEKFLVIENGETKIEETIGIYVDDKFCGMRTNSLFSGTDIAGIVIQNRNKEKLSYFRGSYDQLADIFERGYVGMDYIKLCELNVGDEILTLDGRFTIKDIVKRLIDLETLCPTVCIKTEDANGAEITIKNERIVCKV